MAALACQQNRQSNSKNKHTYAPKKHPTLPTLLPFRAPVTRSGLATTISIDTHHRMLCRVMLLLPCSREPGPRHAKLLSTAKPVPRAALQLFVVYQKCLRTQHLAVHNIHQAYLRVRAFFGGWWGMVVDGVLRGTGGGGVSLRIMAYVYIYNCVPHIKRY